MTEKKIVDDYYSKINFIDVDKSNIDKNVVPKRKKIIKKVIIKDENLEKKVIDEGGKNVIPKKIIKSNIIQKIEVVKKKEIQKQEKKVEKNIIGNSNIEKKVGNIVEKKVNINIVNNGKNSFFSKDFVRNKPFQNKPKSSFNKSNDLFTKDDAVKKSKLWLLNHKKNRWRIRWAIEEELTFTRSNKMLKVKKEEKKVEDIKQNLIERKWEIVNISDFLTLKEFSEKIWIAMSVLMAEFMKNGLMVNINSKIDFETALIIADAFEVKVERDKSVWVNIEDIMKWDLTELLLEDDATKLVLRSPVISIMWHVDHWKTSLLDYIRKSKITEWEAWWITQSIWAYQVEQWEWKITFLDTPGHEAFTIMRSRWAKLTDIAVLVVAADEWIKPQTIESIAHAKEAWIPVIVAINKMDKVWANPDNIKRQLSDYWLISEDWWWDVPMIPVSAITWFGVLELLEIILLTFEMNELKANPNRRGIATVIESHLDQRLWAVATVLINTWTINKWDNIVCQDAFWKIKILRDHTLNNIKFGLPGQPVLIVWLDKVLEWGDILQVVSSSEVAKQKAMDYKESLFRKKKDSKSGLDLLMLKIKAWNLKQLKIVLKADTNWSLEAMKWALEKLSTNDTAVSIIHCWVWNINEWDILMSKWSEAILIWFWVPVLLAVKSLIFSSWIEFINSDIIYHITEKIEKIITWMFNPKEVEVVIWNAKVWWIFYTSKLFLILWLILKADNKIERNALLRVIRNKKMIWTWKVESLKQWVEEVKELEWPIECWIKFIWKVEVELWDELEIYKIEMQK